MQPLLLVSLALELAAFLGTQAAGKDFTVKVAGKLVPEAYLAAKVLPLPALPQFTLDVEYSDALTVHEPLPPEELWLALDLKRRGSQQVGLCLGQGVRCEVAFDESKNELLVRGEDFDMAGLLNYDRVLLLHKPEGFG